MKRQLTIGACLLMLAALVFNGCGSDDECPVCPEFSQKALMYGEIDLGTSTMDFEGYIMGIDGAMPDVDSIRLMGSRIRMVKVFFEGEKGYRLTYEGASQGLISGDTAEVEIFLPDGKCNCEVTVLIDPDDRPEIIDWDTEYPYTDTVAVDAEVVFDWHPVENAEWYLIKIDYAYSFNEVDQGVEMFTVIDTTFTFPANMTSRNGTLGVRVYSVTGPTLEDVDGNITGGFVKGAINTSVESVVGITIGTGIILSPFKPGNINQTGGFLEILRGAWQ